MIRRNIEDSVTHSLAATLVVLLNGAPQTGSVAAIEVKACASAGTAGIPNFHPALPIDI